MPRKQTNKKTSPVSLPQTLLRLNILLDCFLSRMSQMLIKAQCYLDKNLKGWCMGQNRLLFKIQWCNTINFFFLSCSNPIAFCRRVLLCVLLQEHRFLFVLCLYSSLYLPNSIYLAIGWGRRTRNAWRFLYFRPRSGSGYLGSHSIGRNFRHVTSTNCRMWCSHVPRREAEHWYL